MYTEQTNFSIKNVILQFLFVALFIFILIWLFPLKSDLNKAVEGANGTDLTVLTDRIFNENIISMKDAAKSYYTTSRLPQNVGDKVKMTLGEMLEKKIILPFTDKDGKTCSLTESYVEITKYDEEFIMKVNLKCGEEENYLLVYMGCYDYCSTTLCEKNTSDVKSPTIYSSNKTTTEKVVEKETIKTPTIVINNNNTNNNSNTTIVNPTPEPTPDVKPDPKPSTPEPTPTVEYLYEYKKTTKGYYKESNWSDWSTTEVSASSTKAVRVKTTTEKVLKGYNVKKGYDYNKPIYANKVEFIGTETILTCDKWEYVSAGTTRQYNGEWQYAGLVTLYSVPTNTDTVKYEFVRFTDETCSNSCSSTTGMIYKKYVVGSSSVDLSTYECTSSSYKTINLYTTVQTITGYETYVISKTPVYEEVEKKYYSYKTREYIEGTTDVKWSSYNDTTLLTSGYKYTGNKKVK